MNRTLLCYCIITLILASCGVYNSNKLLADSKEPTYTLESNQPKSTALPIQPGDNLSIKIYPNHGENALMSIASIKAEEKSSKVDNVFTVNSFGVIKLPLIGELTVKNLTTDQLADTLSLALAKTIQAPYTEVSITNQRIMLFNGKGAGQVIPLTNESMTLMEVLALGGGVKDEGKSNQIRMIRLENGVRKIYEFDLSELNHLKNADVTVQHRDIVVVNHHPRIGQNVLRDAGPWLSILTSGLVIFSIFSKL
ncbi:MAG: polysaccharide biosynthesis/export family protein [Flavobacteriales bacterium]